MDVSVLILNIVAVILVAFAALANAMMDTLKDRWYKFRWKYKVNPDWWNPENSWYNKYRLAYKGRWWVPHWLSDAWRLFKTVFLFLVLSGPLFITPLTDYWFEKPLWFCVFGIVWILFFNLGYNHMFVIKTKKDEKANCK